MPRFGTRSTLVLMSVDPRLRDIFYEVIKEFDVSITCGHRGQEEQDFYYHNGYSKLKFPNSKHNSNPSMAIDVVPWPSKFEKKLPFYYMAGYVQAVADRLGHRIRWGGDWDGDNDYYDQTFMDLPHFELL